jgi:hypothetical protein
MRTFVWIAILALALPLGAAVLRADEEPAAPAVSPETKARIDALIRQLGADDFRSREAASRELATLGDAARKALENAARASQSPEVRWRAEQLLRRLEGSDEKPLGGERAREPGAPEGEPEDPLEAARRLIKEWTERMKKLRESPWGDPFGPMPWGPLSGPRKVEVPGLVLERTGPGQVQLRVKRKTDAGAEIEDVFEGHSLRDILNRNPELQRHPGMDDLKRKEAERSWPGFEEFLERRLPRVRVEPFSGGSGFSLSTSQGIEVTHGPDGVTVRIKERGEDGQEKVKEYKGESLDQLKRDNPELKEKLKGFGFEFRFGPPEIIWPGRPKERLRPLPPTTPPSEPQKPEATGARFGLTVVEPDEALASHLGLPAGRGALVVAVLPGSQAAQLGIQRNDIIVKVDGVGVGVDGAVDRLRQAAAGKASVRVELIRRGENVTLSR